MIVAAGRQAARGLRRRGNDSGPFISLTTIAAANGRGPGIRPFRDAGGPAWQLSINLTGIVAACLVRSCARFLCPGEQATRRYRNILSRAGGHLTSCRAVPGRREARGAKSAG
jgi:hypothetical protein